MRNYCNPSAYYYIHVVYLIITIIIFKEKMQF